MKLYQYKKLFEHVIVTSFFMIVVISIWFANNPNDQLIVSQEELLSIDENDKIVATKGDIVFDFNIYNILFMITKIVFWFSLGWLVSYHMVRQVDRSLYPNS